MNYMIVNNVPVMFHILYTIYVLQGSIGEDGPSGKPGPTVRELPQVIGVTALMQLRLQLTFSSQLKFNVFWPMRIANFLSLE